MNPDSPATVLDSSVYNLDPETGVWRRGRESTFAYSDGDDAENYLQQVFEQTQDVSCASDELVREIRDWPSEYHLSPTRHNLLRGLHFSSQDRILEIGSGCGALTRFLGESGADVLALEGSSRRAGLTANRCRDLDNVSVCNDNFQDFQASGQFSVVTMIGVLEYAPIFFDSDDPVGAFLRRASDLLDLEGVLVLAIENRLGLKYFNGCSEDHTNRYFDSINDLYEPKGPRTFGYQELSRLLNDADLSHREWIYPFPDYKLPTALVRESATDNKVLDVATIAGHGIARDYVRERRPLFSDRLAWSAIARNGLLPHMANSFLVAASRVPIKAEFMNNAWQIKTFSSVRKSPYRTENTVERRNDAWIVNKCDLHGAPTATGPLRRIPLTEQPYITGELLSMRLERITFEPDSHSRYLRYLKAYLDYLAAHIASAQEQTKPLGDRLLPPDHFDCIPGNLIVDSQGDWHYIDREWEFEMPVTLGYLLFRAMIHDLTRVTVYGSFDVFAGATNLREFIELVFSKLGIQCSATNWRTWIDNEGRVLDQLLVMPDPAHPLHRLDAALEDLFVRVADPLAWRGVPHEGAGATENLRQQLRDALSVKQEIEMSTSYRIGRVLVGVIHRPMQAVVRLFRRDKVV